MSSFWVNVKKLLPYKNLEVKDLAFRAGVPYSTIINGMNKNSMPHADLALKISKIMSISLESLLGEQDIKIKEDENLSQSDMTRLELTLYRNNKLIIDALEEIPVTVRESIKELIIKTRNSYL